MFAASLSHSDLSLILVILAVLCLLIGVYCGYIRNIPGAVIAAVIGLVLLVVAL